MIIIELRTFITLGPTVFMLKAIVDGRYEAKTSYVWYYKPNSRASPVKVQERNPRKQETPVVQKYIMHTKQLIYLCMLYVYRYNFMCLADTYVIYYGRKEK